MIIVNSYKLILSETPQLEITLKNGKKKILSLAVKKEALFEFSEVLIQQGKFANAKITNDIALKNSSRNRHTNALANDSTRVELQVKDPQNPDGYINANRIQNSGNLLWIATQGPLDTTTCDFFQMLYEQGKDKDKKLRVLRLANPIENGRKKCANYWNPDSIPNLEKTAKNKFKFTQGDQTYAVTIIPESPENDKNTKILIANTANSKEIVEIEMIPFIVQDFGAPKPGSEEENAFYQLIHDVRNKDMVVQCSAGLGRTGMALACCEAINTIETELNKVKTKTLIEQIQWLENLNFDISEIIYKQRCDRKDLVQDPSQIICIQRMIKRYIRERIEYRKLLIKNKEEEIKNKPKPPTILLETKISIKDNKSEIIKLLETVFSDDILTDDILEIYKEKLLKYSELTIQVIEKSEEKRIIKFKLPTESVSLEVNSDDLPSFAKILNL